MPGEPSEEVLGLAEELTEEAVRKEPLLSSRTKKTRQAAAYFIAATKLGRQTSLYDAADLFGASNTSVRACYGLMAKALGLPKTVYRAERTRNSYDIYAEILKKEGMSTTELITKIHIKSSELSKHLSLMLKRGLLEKRRERDLIRYYPTERGNRYLEHYSRLMDVLEEG